MVLCCTYKFAAVMCWTSKLHPCCIAAYGKQVKRCADIGRLLSYSKLPCVTICLHALDSGQHLSNSNTCSSPTRPPRTVTMIWHPKQIPRMRCCLSKAVRSSACNFKFHSSLAYASLLLPVTQMPCSERVFDMWNADQMHVLLLPAHLEALQLIVSGKVAIDWVKDMPLFIVVGILQQVFVQLAIVTKPTPDQ